MSPNTNFSAGSLLATPISSVPRNSSAQGTRTSFMLPKIGSLPAGCYDSVLVDVTEAVQNGQCVGLDCYHDLVDSKGNQFHVRFRYYAPREVYDLVATLDSYGLTGTLAVALLNLHEDVEIAPKQGISDYLAIVGRSIKAATASTASHSVQQASTSSCVGSPAKKGISLSKMPKKHLGGSHLSSRRSELLEDDDDDFDADLDDMDD